MEGIVLFVLAAYAAWFIFTTADVPVWGPVREYLSTQSVTLFEFLDCPICSGFWVSLVLSLVFPLAEGTGLTGLVIQSLCGAGAVYLIETHMRRITRQ